MIRWRSLTCLFLAFALVLAPALAEARAGGSYRSGGGSSFSSQGSRGSQTYQSDGAAPIQRSLTPDSSSPAPYAPGYGGYGSSHPFLSGLAGGLFGTWLGSLLFPHWGMGYGYGGMMGSFFTWIILLGLIWWVIRRFVHRPMTVPGMAPIYHGGALPLLAGAGGGRTATLGVTGADYQQFEDILRSIQAGWSRGDLSQLRHYATPEMLSYFSEQLAENESQGVSNRVENVELLKGDVRKAWDEGNLHYATALLHWRALDYTVRSDRNDVIVGGDPQRPSEAAEMWTFARSPGGRWLLSAIQQLR